MAPSTKFANLDSFIGFSISKSDLHRGVFFIFGSRRVLMMMTMTMTMTIMVAVVAVMIKMVARPGMREERSGM